MRSYRFYIAFCVLIYAISCDYDPAEPADTGNLLQIAYSPEPIHLVVPSSYPSLEVPADNPLTREGILLGRKLFYDPILSRDSTQACASCHHPELNFTDTLPVSKGVDGLPGRRSAMSLLDNAFQHVGLFWDGRVSTLEEQALKPVEDVKEMHALWPDVINKLKRSAHYPAEFRRAFGIPHRDSITKGLAVKAIAQFERTIISSGKSKYDLALTPGSGVFFSESELRGYEMFFDQSGRRLPDAECFHCHNAPLMASSDYFNNGIQPVNTLQDFTDKGRGEVTGKLLDNGMFRAPSLRNIDLTPPYMHDGRFKTLSEVIDHYNAGGFPADNKNPFIRKLGLTPSQKADLLAFLHTLTDSTIIIRQDFRSPF
jgi:cytochrome c peroxidase